jgi:hypothetical protein
MSAFKENISTDIKDLGHSMKEQLSQYALNQEKQFSQYALNQEKQLSQYALSQQNQLSQYALSQEKQFSQHAQNQDKQFAQFYFRSLSGVSLTPYIMYQFLTRLRSWVLQYCWSAVHGSYR